MANVPTFAQWLCLTDDERAQLLSSWNAYAGEGETLVRDVMDRFQAEYGQLKGVTISGPGVYHCGEWIIRLTHPFIFDRRTLPGYYLGVRIMLGYALPLPPEFEGQRLPQAYVWAPTNYERFVDRCGGEIRRQLGQPDMTREEMLDALVGFSFEWHRRRCRDAARNGILPPFE